MQLIQRERLRQFFQPLLVARVHRGVMRTDKCRKIFAGETVRIGESTATHAIKQNIGKMMDARRLIGGLLQTVGGSDTAAQAVAVDRETLAQGTFEGRRFLQLILK